MVLLTSAGEKNPFPVYESSVMGWFAVISGLALGALVHHLHLLDETREQFFAGPVGYTTTPQTTAFLNNRDTLSTEGPQNTFANMSRGIRAPRFDNVVRRPKDNQTLIEEAARDITKDPDGLRLLDDVVKSKKAFERPLTNEYMEAMTSSLDDSIMGKINAYHNFVRQKPKQLDAIRKLRKETVELGEQLVGLPPIDQIEEVKKAKAELENARAADANTATKRAEDAKKLCDDLMADHIDRTDAIAKMEADASLHPHDLNLQNQIVLMKDRDRQNGYKHYAASVEMQTNQAILVERENVISRAEANFARLQRQTVSVTPAHVQQIADMTRRASELETAHEEAKAAWQKWKNDGQKTAVDEFSGVNNMGTKTLGELATKTAQSEKLARIWQQFWSKLASLVGQEEQQNVIFAGTQDETARAKTHAADKAAKESAALQRGIELAKNRFDVEKRVNVNQLIKKYELGSLLPVVLPALEQQPSAQKQTSWGL